MGWCSGTDVFDTVVGYVLEHANIDKKELVKAVAQVLMAMDWDCQGDSEYWQHPMVQEIFAELCPGWFTDEEEHGR